MHLRIIASILLGLWFLLVLMGKSGFVHVLLLIGICVGLVEVVTIYRAKLKQ